MLRPNDDNEMMRQAIDRATLSADRRSINKLKEQFSQISNPPKKPNNLGWFAAFKEFPFSIECVMRDHTVVTLSDIMEGVDSASGGWANYDSYRIPQTDVIKADWKSSAVIMKEEDARYLMENASQIYPDAITKIMGTGGAILESEKIDVRQAMQTLLSAGDPTEMMIAYIGWLGNLTVERLVSGANVAGLVEGRQTTEAREMANLIAVDLVSKMKKGDDRTIAEILTNGADSED